MEVFDIDYKSPFLNIKSKFGGNQFININNSEFQSINHILPEQTSKKPAKIYLPSDFLNLIAISYYLGISSDISETRKTLDFDHILNIEIKYIDIGSNTHIKRFKLKFTISSAQFNEKKELCFFNGSIILNNLN